MVHHNQTQKTRLIKQQTRIQAQKQKTKLNKKYAKETCIT
jgi:hypothetical protein